MKSYTDLEQAKKLAEFLPIESADMYYNLGESILPNVIYGGHNDFKCYLPCWSLASLMDVLERGILFKTPQGWACQTYIEYKAITSDYYNNPIDTCVVMIEKLHKQKLL